MSQVEILYAALALSTIIWMCVCLNLIKHHYNLGYRCGRAVGEDTGLKVGYNMACKKYGYPPNPEYGDPYWEVERGRLVDSSGTYLQDD